MGRPKFFQAAEAWPGGSASCSGDALQGNQTLLPGVEYAQRAKRGEVEGDFASRVRNSAFAEASGGRLHARVDGCH